MDITVKTLCAYREKIWMSRPKPEARRKLIQNELKTAHQEFLMRLNSGGIKGSEYSEPFYFKINSKEVCEKAFTNVLGLADKAGNIFIPWKEESAIFQGKIALATYLCINKYDLS